MAPDIRTLALPIVIVAISGLSEAVFGQDANGAAAGATEREEQPLPQMVRTGVDIEGTGKLFTVGFDRTSRSMGKLWVRSESAPESAAQTIGVFQAYDVHKAFEAVDSGDLSPLRALFSLGQADIAPSHLQAQSFSQPRTEFGWNDFDAEFGTLRWMAASDDDRPLLPMVWTCLDTMVEVSFPRTAIEKDSEPWQMFLRVDGQRFESDVSVHEHGLTASYPLASGLLSALRQARELVLAPDGADQVILPAQSGDLDARDRFVTWCLMLLERSDAATP